MATRFLGPSGSVRRHTRLLTLSALIAAAFTVFFVAASGANLTGSTFESTDGNLIKSTGTDWCNTVVSNVCTSTAPNLVQGQDKTPGAQTDDSFANGTKQDDAVPSIGTGGIPNKGDLDRFYISSELVSNKNFVYLGFELLPVSNASASVHTGFEFNKNFCDPVTHTGCSTNNVTPARSEGDILIVYDIEGGGNPSLSFRRWVLSGTCEVSQDTAPCWGPKQTFTSATADGSLNTADVTDPINPGAPRTIGNLRFGEAAINLTDSNILTGCAGLGSVYVVSRSSGDSGTATMKDFIAPQKVNINNCGTIKVKKVTQPSPDPTTTSFSFAAGGGLTPTSFSLANGGTQTYTGVNPGSGYNVSETVPTNWGLISSSCDNGSAVSNISVNAGQTVTCTFTNGLKPTLTVTKACVPTTDSGKFDLKIGATVKKTDATCTAGISGTDNTTGAVVLDPNTYTVSEAAGTGTNLSHYDTSIGGDCTSGGSVTLSYGDAKTCTITNSRLPTLTVTKACVPSNDGGKFNLKIGSTVDKADALCTAGISGTDNTTGAIELPTGTYTVSETAGTGTDLGNYSAAIGGACSSVGSVTLAYGDNKTCTITNTRRKFTIVTYVCETTSGTPALYKSSVLLPDPGGSSKTTETAVPSGTSASAICGLAANYPNLNTGTFTGTVTIGTSPAP